MRETRSSGTVGGPGRKARLYPESCFPLDGAGLQGYIKSVMESIYRALQL